MSLILDLLRWEEIATVKLVKWIILFVVGFYISYFILEIHDLVLALGMSFITAEILIHIVHDKPPERYDFPEQTYSMLKKEDGGKDVELSGEEVEEILQDK